MIKTFLTVLLILSQFKVVGQTSLPIKDFIYVTYMDSIKFAIDNSFMNQIADSLDKNFDIFANEASIKNYGGISKENYEWFFEDVLNKALHTSIFRKVKVVKIFYFLIHKKGEESSQDFAIQEWFFEDAKMASEAFYYLNTIPINKRLLRMQYGGQIINWKWLQFQNKIYLLESGAYDDKFFINECKKIVEKVCTGN